MGDAEQRRGTADQGLRPAATNREDTNMAFSAKSNKDGTEYYLYSVSAANGKTRLYHFAKDANKKDDKSRPEADLPEGYEVSENSFTGLPILKKKK